MYNTVPTAAPLAPHEHNGRFVGPYDSLVGFALSDGLPLLKQQDPIRFAPCAQGARARVSAGHAYGLDAVMYECAV